MKITYHAASSSDGFIAREDGDVSWLDEAELDASDDSLEKFFAEVDGLVMGRGTYDFVFNYGAWPYEDKPSWVCTSRDLEALEGANLRIVDSVDAVMKGATAEGHEHLWLIGGGELATAFLKKGLLTHISITEMPVILGAGIPLFARHTLKNIPVENFSRTKKKGCDQLELTVSAGND